MAAVNARWIVPVAVTALVVGGGVAASAASDASPDLPDVSAEDLLVKVHEAEPTAFSGTVRTVADLGLPAIGDLAGMAGGGGAAGGGEQATDPASVLMRLASGENQLRVWVGGPEQQRVSLLDDFAELDVVRDGDELWTYSSTDDTATFYDLPAIAAEAEAGLTQAQEDFAAAEPEKAAELAEELEAAEAEARARAEQPSPYADLTPAELARTLLADADETTEVAVGDTQVVAGRDAYTLTATPRDDATLVGTIEVAVDAETGVVLQVQVGARDQSSPAFVTGFTDLDLTAPDADVFAFSPAAGTTVVDALEAAQEEAAEAPAPGTTDDVPAPGERVEQPEPVVHGEGWSTAVEVRLPVEELSAAGEDAAAQDAEASTPVPEETDPFAGAEELDPTALLEQLTTEVDGGRVLTSALLTVLLTDDGRVLVGPVDAATLQSYAG